MIRLVEKLNFSSRLIAFSTSLVVISVGISTLISHQYNKKSLEARLGQELLAIVNTAASSIDGDTHESIVRITPQLVEGWPEFEKIRTLLLTVKARNQMRGHADGSPLYTLRPSQDFVADGKLEFVAMTDRDERGQFFIGSQIPAQGHHRQVLQGKPAVTPIYQDSEGIWISAAAPVFDSSGAVVAILQADRPISFFFSKAREGALRLLLGALLSVMLGGGLSLAFANGLVRPLKQLVTAANELGAGNLEARVAIQRGDELGILARSFNNMAENLKVAAQKEEHQKQVLIQAWQAADEGTRAKSVFLANMSHELRTPLNAIIGYSEMLCDVAEEQRSTELLSDLRKIQSAGRHLLKLVSDILDLSRIEEGKMELSVERFRVREMVEDVVGMVQPLVKNNGNRLEVKLRPGLGEIAGDETKIRQVLFNLLNNASKFTTQGWIRLTVKRVKEEGSEWLEFHVEDSGIGMSQEQVQKLFQPFTQADSSTSRKYGGTGLGLAISQQFCQLMEGDLRVESELGQGTTFVFRVPTDGPLNLDAQPVGSGVRESSDDRSMFCAPGKAALASSLPDEGDSGTGSTMAVPSCMGVPEGQHEFSIASQPASAASNVPSRNSSSWPER